MAVPTVAINSGTGSDSAASGAGPSTAITGTLAATHANTTVNITDAVALGGVAVDGSAVLWVSSSSGRQYSAITAISGSSGAWVVTVGSAYANTESGRTWGIGGKRATLAGSLRLGLDVNPGWTIDVQTGETLAANWVLTPASATQGLCVNFTSTTATFDANGMPTAPVLTTSTNSVCGLDISGALSVNISNIYFKSTAGTPSDGIVPLATSPAPFRITIYRCVIDGFRYGIRQDDPGGFIFIHGLSVIKTEIKNCTTGGILQNNDDMIELDNVYVHNNTGQGFHAVAGGCIVKNSIFNSNTGDNIRAVLQASRIYSFVNNTFSNGTLAGLFLQNSTDSVVVVKNNLFYGNARYGVEQEASAVDAFINRNNAYGANTLGARLVWPAGTGDVTLTASPFTSSTDFGLNGTAGGGAACRAAGDGWAGSATATAPDIGAIQSGSSAGGFVGSRIFTGQ